MSPCSANRLGRNYLQGKIFIRAGKNLFSFIMLLSCRKTMLRNFKENHVYYDSASCS